MPRQAIVVTKFSYILSHVFDLREDLLRRKKTPKLKPIQDEDQDLNGKKNAQNGRGKTFVLKTKTD